MRKSLLKKIILGFLCATILLGPAVIPTSVRAESVKQVVLTPILQQGLILEKGLAWFNDNAEAIKEYVQTLGLLRWFAKLTDEAVQTDPFFYEPINKGIQAGNQFILNLINLFYILILLLIALATIFDFEAYSAGKLLPKLVFAIILSNFGLFFVKAIADFSQLLSQGLLGDGANTLVDKIVGSISDIEFVTTLVGRAGLFAASIVSGGATVPLQFLFEIIQPTNWFIVAFLLTTLILWLRIAGLWIFAVFAPFGVAFGVLPSTQGFAQLYWKKVISYAFVGPVIIFFIRLAIIFFEAMSNPGALDSYVGIVSDETDGSITGNVFVRDLGTVIILYMGIVFAKKMGVEVANFVIDKAQKTFKTAWTAATIIGTAGAGAAVGAVSKGLAAGEGIGASLGKGAAALNESGGLRRNVGIGMQGTFGKKSLLGQVGGGLIGSGDRASARGKEAATEEAAAKERRQYNDQEGANAANRRVVQKSKQYDNQTINPTALPGATPEERAASALALARTGGVNKGNMPAISAQVDPQFLELIKSQAANNDLTAKFDPAAPDFEEKVSNWVKTNGVNNQKEGLENEVVARVVLENLSDAELGKVSKIWKDGQRDSFNVGASKVTRTMATSNDARYSDTFKKAVLGGANPVEMMRQNNAAAITAGHDISGAHDQIEKTVYSDASYYVNQPTTVSVQMMNRLGNSNPANLGKVLGVLNHQKLRNRTDMKAALVAAAKNSAFGREISDGIMAHLKTRMSDSVDRLADLQEKMNKKQEELEESLGDVKGSIKGLKK